MIMVSVREPSIEEHFRIDIHHHAQPDKALRLKHPAIRNGTLLRATLLLAWTAITRSPGNVSRLLDRPNSLPKSQPAEEINL